MCIYIYINVLLIKNKNNDFFFVRIMTCDWKALSLIKGINGAQCDHFCMWCHCSKRQICDFSSNFFFQDHDDV